MRRAFATLLILTQGRAFLLPSTPKRSAYSLRSSLDGEGSSTLTEPNVELALESARTELSALFGYTPENRAVGITGQVDLVEINGPTVILRLSGRRIPEFRY